MIQTPPRCPHNRLVSRWASLLGFLVLVVGGGAAIGVATGPGEWYAGLAKPSFNPPNWVFGPVWTTLYVLIAVAGWRVTSHMPGSAAARLWWVQLVLNFLWSPAFFGLQRMDLALGIIGMLMASIVAFIAAAGRRERTAAWLFVPYACWVAFATVLNAALLVLN